MGIGGVELPEKPDGPLCAASAAKAKEAAK